MLVIRAILVVLAGLMALPGVLRAQEKEEYWRPRTGREGARPVAGIKLDYEFFKTQVQPIFLLQRPGMTRCVACHSTGTPMRLQALSPGATMWDEEQSRKNFEVVSRRVVPGDPYGSKLLAHPLRFEAGGDPYHSGGKHWSTAHAPDWQVLAAWVMGKTAAK